MSIVAGVDFGTLSVRVSLFRKDGCRLGFGLGDYPLERRKDDPDYATQSHDDQMGALVVATKRAIAAAGVDGHSIEAIAIDTTGSSVVPVDSKMNPIGPYYLWCDHRGWKEAAEITAAAHRLKLPAIEYCGGTYSSEWGFSKLLHWLRHNPDLRAQTASAFEHCDMVAATLCGITDPAKVMRSVCAIGHKWMWNEALGGLPSNDFLAAVDPLLDGFRAKLESPVATSDKLAGTLCEFWAGEMGLKPGIPIPVGAFDAHWDALGAGAALGDVVNIVGTSTCIIAMNESSALVPGLCGVVQGSVDPQYTGIEAGMSATGDVFDAISRRSGTPLAVLSNGLENYRPGGTGMLRIPWDNGDRTILVNPEVSGVTLGWRITHTAQDELFAAIEGAGFHTRVIFERMEQYEVPIRRVINGGGIPRKNNVLNQTYANILNKPVLVPESDVTSLGSAIFAFLAAGVFGTIAEAQKVLVPKHRVFTPNSAAHETYNQLYSVFREFYFSLGEGKALPELRRIAMEART